MTEWEPATDAEVAMRNALRADDQESYFRILAGVDLLLPVTADALAGLEPLGWGTWSTGGRTHVLAFTSPAALQGCLADYTGSARRVPYQELAETWPNLEWWLAVNPGLPIEGYLPAWFVAQLSRGDLRMPTRGPGRDADGAGSRIPDLQAAAMAASAAAAQNATAQNATAHNAAAQSATVRNYANPESGGPVSGSPAPAGVGAGVPAGYGSPAGSGAAGGFGSPAGPDAPGGYEALPRRGDTSGGFGVMPGDGAASGGGAPVGGLGGLGGGAARGGSSAESAAQGGGGQQASVGPGGLPLRTPGAVLPSGLPSRVPSTPPGLGGSGPVTSFSGFTPAGGRQGAEQEPAASPSQAVDQDGPNGVTSAEWDSDQLSQSPAAARTGSVPGGFSSSVATGSALDALASRSGTTAPVSGPSALDALGSRGSHPAETGPAGLPPIQSTDGPLPTRTPMAQTPPVPSHIPAPERATSQPEPDMSRPATSGLPAETSSGLPRRQVTPPSERPSSMAAAAQALAAKGVAGASPEVPPTSADPAVTTRLTLPGPTTQTSAPRPAPAAGSLSATIAPPVIPGPTGGNAVPAPATRPEIPQTGGGSSTPSQAEPQGFGGMAPTSGGGMDRPGRGDDFLPANDVERDLYHASLEHSTDSFLSTLLLATVLVPVADHSRPGSAPGESGFAFRTEDIGGERFLLVFTSRDRLGDHFDEPVRTAGVRFVELIQNWPDPAWAFAVNPGSVVGAKYPGQQVVALASWAVEAGLGRDADDVPLGDVGSESDGETDALPTMMQKTVPPEQVDFYLERGYDRVAGFVHRSAEVEHLRTPAELFAALGLVHDESPYQADAKEVYLLRWPAFRPSLYRIPYGGQNEQALRAMDGWVIERPPFRGNGFAPGEGRDVIAEFKVDSVRLPSGAQLWRIDADGAERIVAVFDTDVPAWRKVGEQDA